MSKSITISEGLQAKNFSNVSKIRVNNIGGGTSDWIPEEDAGMYANLEELSVSKNGTYKASDEDVDGFSKVTVKVEPKVTTKTITKNGTYKASKDKVDGYSEVSVQVPTEGGGGGGEPTLITKNITENGTYNASDDDADGYSSVTVNVSGGSISGETITATALEDLQAGDKVYIKNGFADDLTLLGNISEDESSGWVLYDGSQYLYYAKNGDIYRKTIANIGVPNTGELAFHDDVYGLNFSGSEETVGGKMLQFNTGGNPGHVYTYSALVNNLLQVGSSGLVGGYEFNGLCPTGRGMVTESNEKVNDIQYYFNNMRGAQYGYQDINAVSFGDRGWRNKIPQTMVGTPSNFESYDLSAFFPYEDFATKYKTCHPVGNYMLIWWDGHVYANQIGTTNVQDLGLTYSEDVFITHNADSSRLIESSNEGTFIVDSGLNLKEYSNVLGKSYIIGEYIVRGSNHNIYSFITGRTMSKTGDKSKDSMGICQSNVSKNEQGTAIIVFS